MKPYMLTVDDHSSCVQGTLWFLLLLHPVSIDLKVCCMFIKICSSNDGTAMKVSPDNLPTHNQLCQVEQHNEIGDELLSNFRKMSQAVYVCLWCCSQYKCSAKSVSAGGGAAHTLQGILQASCTDCRCTEFCSIEHCCAEWPPQTMLRHQAGNTVFVLEYTLVDGAVSQLHATSQQGHKAANRLMCALH